MSVKQPIIFSAVDKNIKFIMQQMGLESEALDGKLSESELRQKGYEYDLFISLAQIKASQSKDEQRQISPMEAKIAAEKLRAFIKPKYWNGVFKTGTQCRNPEDLLATLRFRTEAAKSVSQTRFTVINLSELKGHKNMVCWPSLRGGDNYPPEARCSTHMLPRIWAEGKLFKSNQLPKFYKAVSQAMVAFSPRFGRLRGVIPHYLHGNGLLISAKGHVLTLQGNIRFSKKGKKGRPARVPVAFSNRRTLTSATYEHYSGQSGVRIYRMPSLAKAVKKGWVKPYPLIDETKLKQGDQILMAGYRVIPQRRRNNPKEGVRWSAGRVTAVNEKTVDADTTGMARKMMAGGPAVNDKGRIVGLVLGQKLDYKCPVEKIEKDTIKYKGGSLIQYKATISRIAIDGPTYISFFTPEDIKAIKSVMGTTSLKK